MKVFFLICEMQLYIDILIKIGNIKNKDLIIFSFPFMNKWCIDEKEMQKREKIVGL